MANEEAKIHKMNRRGRPKMTIQEKLYSTLEKNKEFVALKALYKILRARTIGDRAGIRGVLNRGCVKGGIFRRNTKSHGEYTLAA